MSQEAKIEKLLSGRVWQEVVIHRKLPCMEGMMLILVPRSSRGSHVLSIQFSIIPVQHCTLHTYAWQLKTFHSQLPAVVYKIT